MQDTIQGNTALARSRLGILWFSNIIEALTTSMVHGTLPQDRHHLAPIIDFPTTDCLLLVQTHRNRLLPLHEVKVSVHFV